MRTAMIGLVAAAIGCVAPIQAQTQAQTQAPTQAQTALERGKYLVEGIVGCGNCHTPQGPTGPVMARAFSGGPPIDDAMVGKIFPSNITPDPDTGIGKWTDAQLKGAIREGKRPDGSLIGPPMPFYYYRHISDADLDAIVAYLRTLPPVSNKVASSQYKIALPPAYGPPIAAPITAPAPADKLAYGAYLAGPLGHCLECHTPMGPKGIMYDTDLGAGGLPFTGPWGISVSKNITPDPDHGLASWTDAQIDRAIRTGVNKDGQKMMPPMGYGYYAKVSAEDMGALIAYLRSMPAKKSP